MVCHVVAAVCCNYRLYIQWGEVCVWVGVCVWGGYMCIFDICVTGSEEKDNPSKYKMPFLNDDFIY